MYVWWQLLGCDVELCLLIITSCLPGVDDAFSRQDFAKDIGNAMAGMSDSFVDTDFFGADEALKMGLDPLDLDGLQMLTDSSLVTDPATEDTFRLNRL